LPNLALFCSNYKTSKKIKCTHKPKTIKKKLIHHSSYLGVNYDNAAQGLTNMNKEIKRDKLRNTICRIIIGGNIRESRVSFFNLQEVKTPNLSELNLINIKLVKMIKQDYIHQDIYMNKKLFKTIIDDSKPLKDNLNPLEYTYLISLDTDHKPHDTLICI